MSSLKFYIIFNILNILLIAFILFCMNGVFDLISDISPNANIMLLWGLALYITYVTLKLRLPKLIVKSGKKYTKTIINQFVEYLQNNPQNKKKILTIAFCYDIPFLIYSIHVYIDVGRQSFNVTYTIYNAKPHRNLIPEPGEPCKSKVKFILIFIHNIMKPINNIFKILKII